MAAILTLLQSLQPNTPQLCKDDRPDYWCFKSKLLDNLKPNRDGVDFFRPFIYNYDHLLIIYALNCSLIAKRIQSSKSLNKEDLILEELLKNALTLANLLHVINTQYFHSPQECRRLEKEEFILRRLLRIYGYKFELILNFDLAENNDEAKEADQKSISQWVRENTSTVNWPRLLIVRMKRVFDTLVPILKNLPNFVNAIYLIDEIANPIFAYLAWVFYVPRFTFNLFVLLKNVIPHPWMSVRQQQLGTLLRFKSEFRDKWFELGNDGVWLTVGLINCFVLVGALATWSMYLTITLYAFDVALAAIRSNIELNRLHELKAQLIDLSIDSPHSDQLREYLDELNRNIHYESQRLGLSFATTIGLFVGMLFAIPAFSSIPAIPLLGACYIVTLCIGTFAVGNYIKKTNPAKPLPTATDMQLLKLLDSESKGKLPRIPSADLSYYNGQNQSYTSNPNSEKTSSGSLEGRSVCEDGSQEKTLGANDASNQRKPSYDKWRLHSVTTPSRKSVTPPPLFSFKFS